MNIVPPPPPSTSMPQVNSNSASEIPQPQYLNLSDFNKRMDINNIKNIKTNQEWYFSETCTMKAGQSFIVGGLFGTFMGFFMTATTPFSMNNTVDVEAPFKVQAKQMFQDFKVSTKGWMKTGAYFGCAFTGYECLIDSYRAKHDIFSVASAGCLTGATFGAKSGPQTAVMQCVGMAAFSVAIEKIVGDRF